MTQARRIRVMVVDDHPIVQDGLRMLVQLSAGLEWVGQAQSGEEAIARCDEMQPDVVLMDLLMPGMGGVEAIKAIRQRRTTVQVIALTSFAEPDLVQQALKAGAISYVLKNVQAAALAEAIRAAYGRQSVMAPEATAALVQAMQRNTLDMEELSERELAVLCLIADGLTNNQIASRLSIAESTVRFHIGHIFLKLGAHNRAEAVRLAIEANLIPRQRTGN
jgi:NarL family two-component system response regulator LiaR